LEYVIFNGCDFEIRSFRNIVALENDTNVLLVAAPGSRFEVLPMHQAVRPIGCVQTENLFLEVSFFGLLQKGALKIAI